MWDGQEGFIWLSSIYGSYNYTSDIVIPEDKAVGLIDIGQGVQRVDPELLEALHILPFCNHESLQTIAIHTVCGHAVYDEDAVTAAIREAAPGAAVISSGVGGGPSVTRSRDDG